MTDLVTKDDDLEEDDTDSEECDGDHGDGDPHVIQEHLDVARCTMRFTLR